MTYLKKNGGTLFIDCLEGFKANIILLFVFLHFMNVSGQNKNAYVVFGDSCFCYDTYIDLVENEITGLFPPEQLIEGENKSLNDILEKVNYTIIDKYNLKDSIFNPIIMSIVVDSVGVVRCGIMMKGNNKCVALEAYNLLKEEKYKPAMYRGKPKDYWFHYYLAIRKE